MWVLRMGFTGVVGGIGLQLNARRTGVHRSTGFVYARRARGCTGPLQGQAEHQQQGKETGAHQYGIVERRLRWMHIDRGNPLDVQGAGGLWYARMVASSSCATGIGRNAPTCDRPVLPSGSRPSRCPSGTSSSRSS